MRFSRSFCLLPTEFFLSIRTEISVRSLPLCQILQIFTVNFQRYFRSKDKFGKILENTRSLNLHLRESGVLAQARAISAQAARTNKLFRATLRTIEAQIVRLGQNLLVLIKKACIDQQRHHPTPERFSTWALMQDTTTITDMPRLKNCWARDMSRGVRKI